MSSPSRLLSVLVHTALTILICNPYPNRVNGANYTGHAIVRLPLKHAQKLVPNFSNHLLNGSHTDQSQLEVLWTGQDKEKFAVLRVPPEHLGRVRRSARSSFVIPNLGHWINNGHSSYFGSASTRDSDSGAVYSSLVPNFRLDRYHPLSEVYQYLDTLAQSDDKITVFKLGTTHEGREIKAIEVIGNPNDQRLVWIDGCTHAREWITVATATYLIEQAIITKLPVNLVIVPVLNPDGYDYTWSSDRLWRKNRRPYLTPEGQAGSESCTGVDLNRNYDVNFGGSGASSNPCSHLYSGPKALSEPETRAAANLLWSVKDSVQMYISLHSFNQLWSSPFAYTTSPSPHAAIHMDVLKTIQDAVYRTNGVMYKIGPLGESLYVGSGFALDWAYKNAKIVHSYLVELRDEGHYGFLLPVEQIMPTASETWNGIAAAINKVYSRR
ncbi:Carboxypeptidase A2 [Halotydeus destructor]|nr:Carboxypeptidase A2 [Halotydeus destructor]